MAWTSSFHTHNINISGWTCVTIRMLEASFLLFVGMYVAKPHVL